MRFVWGKVHVGNLAALSFIVDPNFPGLKQLLPHLSYQNGRRHVSKCPYSGQF